MDQLLASVENYREDMIREMSDMLRIPAMGPENGGQGEFERARFLGDLVRRCGFEDVQTYEAPDERVELKVRPSVLAKKIGKSERTVWIVSHIDTVAPGELDAWTYPPFEPKLVDGKLYGRGAEDDGQAVISSIFAAKALLENGREPELSIGLALVADEEAGSDYGIKYLLKQGGLFGKDDLFFVPDSGNPEGSLIEVAEKSIIWLRFTVKGMQAHASTPEKGLNALIVGSELLLFLPDQLAGKFPAKDPLFMPPASTFVPTKRLANVESINTLPGEDVFFFDIRLLPHYDPQECIATARKVAQMFEERTGAKIEVKVERTDPAGKASTTIGEGAKALKQAVKRVLGVDPTMIGIGGQTCSNDFRRYGMNAYVWQTVDEVLHKVNEYTKVDNMVGDAKVFAVLLAQLCYPDVYQDPESEY